jgi:hypothetical protein
MVKNFGSLTPHRQGLNLPVHEMKSFLLAPCKKTPSNVQKSPNNLHCRELVHFWVQRRGENNLPHIQYVIVIFAIGKGIMVINACVKSAKQGDIFGASNIILPCPSN